MGGIAGAAQKAVDFILGKVEKMEVPQEGQEEMVAKAA